MTNLQTVTTSGAGGLVADLSSLATVTSINTTANTGASTLTIDGTKTTFTGGAGGDTVALGGTSITKPIDLGAGDDTLVLADGTALPGVVIDGGTGTADILSLALANDVAGTTNTLRWFEIGGDIYILSDVSDATTFVAGADSVVRLVGAAGLNLNSATVANGLITFH